MKNEDESGIDLLLRRALRPDPATVERTVERALGFKAPPRRLVWGAATLGAAALVTLLTIFPVRSPDSRPEHLSDQPRGLTISNENGLVTVTSADGARLVVTRRIR